MQHLGDLPATARFAAVSVYRCLSCIACGGQVGKLWHSHRRFPLYCFAATLCNVFYDREADVNTLHERRQTAASQAKVELEEAFSAPTFGRTATATVRNLRPALDFAADRASAARI